MATPNTFSLLSLTLVVIFSLILLQKVSSSHVLHRQLSNLSPPLVDTTLLTGYHFRPLRNWINGNFLIYFFFLK